MMTEQQEAKYKVAIWWLSSYSTETLYTRNAYDEEGLIKCLPTAVASEVKSRRGRFGNGWLWPYGAKNALLEDGDVELPENHAVAKIIKDENCGGIVIDWQDVPAVIGLPGFVTDLQLNLIHPGDLEQAKESKACPICGEPMLKTAHYLDEEGWATEIYYEVGLITHGGFVAVAGKELGWHFDSQGKARAFIARHHGVLDGKGEQMNRLPLVVQRVEVTRRIL